MKIAIFADTFYPMVNGVVTAIINIAQPLADRGHTVIIVAPAISSKKEFSYPGVIVKHVASIPAGFYKDFRWTPTFSYSTYKLLRDENVDIVHFTSPWTTCYLGIKLARLLDIPVIGTFHTYISDPSYYEHAFKGVIKTSTTAAWKYINLYYNAADFVTAPSPTTLRDMQENGCTVKGDVISNGIDYDVFDNSNWREFKEKYGIKNRAILFIGRIAQEKNLQVLIDGFSKAWRKNNELQLLLIGDGPLKKELEKNIDKLPCKKNIIFTGNIPHEELISSGVFKACWLFATASKTENQPMTILESQVNNLVCIGADAKGIPDLIKSNENGLLFSPEKPEELANVILELDSNECLYKKFKDNTKELIKQHKLSTVADLWEKCYSQVISDYKAGLFVKKEYLHTKEILPIFKEFSIDYKAIFYKNKK